MISLLNLLAAMRQGPVFLRPKIHPKKEKSNV